MTIKTEDREQIRKQAHLTSLGPREHVFQCDRCDWRRTFATEVNAVTKGADHMLTAHRVRLELKRTQPLAPQTTSAKLEAIESAQPFVEAAAKELDARRARRVLGPGMLGILAIAAMFGAPLAARPPAPTLRNLKEPEE